MTTISVDKSKCPGDGRCAEICPVQVLTMNEKEHVPEFIDGGADMCINCGQCFAFCPSGALSLSGLTAGDALRMDYSGLPDARQLELLMKGRRSIRLYKDKPVEKETVEKLIDLARYAPSGINRQPVNWAVITGKEKVHSLGELTVGWMKTLTGSSHPLAESLRFDRLVTAWQGGKDLICRDAPAVVIAYGLKDDPMVPPSCTIAATYLELAAFGSGLGACWAGYVNMAINMSDEVRKFIGLSARATAGAAMMLGYSQYRYSRIPARNAPKILWREKGGSANDTR